MVRDLVGLLLDIENAYESVKLNSDAMSYLQLCFGTGALDQNLLIHLNYLCELEAETHLKLMKGAIDALKQELKQQPESPLPPPVNPPIA
jgi:hypothetical protein